jgi:beta-glucanase (GH16 family)
MSDESAPSPDTREFIWSDEFDGSAGTPVNPRYWTHELGGSGWGNGELQYYTNSPANACLDGNGNLAIVARSDESGRYGPCRYTSARIITKAKFEFAYGEIEARIKIPRGRGIWPALWMLGANLPEVPWPLCGEIDVLENLGHDTRTIYGTVHGPGYSGQHGVSRSYVAASDLAADFHIYTVRWHTDSIRWYLDGHCCHTVTPDDLPGRRWVFDHPFFILVNLAVGGNWPGAPDESTTFPQTLLVDYVRVFT